MCVSLSRAAVAAPVRSVSLDRMVPAHNMCASNIAYLDVAEAERAAHVRARLLRREEDPTDAEQGDLHLVNVHTDAKLAELRALPATQAFCQRSPGNQAVVGSALCTCFFFRAPLAVVSCTAE